MANSILIMQTRKRAMAMNFRRMVLGWLPIMFGLTGPAAAEGNLADGEKMYNKECSVCHGVLSGSKTGDLAPAPLKARPVRLARAPAVERTVADFHRPVMFDEPGTDASRDSRVDRAVPPDVVAVVPIYGPTLKGVVGRVAGSHEGYPYSKAFKQKMEGVTWDEAKLDVWIKSSQTMVPGSFMFYSQKNVGMRGNIIQYLKANSP
jgi:cytochrome c2